MKQIVLTPAVREFVAHLIPHDAELLAVSIADGGHDMEIGYLTAGKQKAHEVVTWSAVSIAEVD